MNAGTGRLRLNRGAALAASTTSEPLLLSPSAAKMTKIELRNQSTRNILISVAAFALLISVLFAIAAGLALSGVWQFTTPASLYVDQQMPTSPYIFHIGGSALPVALTLPNDLTPYIGRIYRIWSISPQIHTVTIQGTGTTWDGTNTVATFGGAIGDGLMFEVLQSNRIVLISVNNVVFS